MFLLLVLVAASCSSDKSQKNDEQAKRERIKKNAIRYERCYEYTDKDGKIDEVSKFLTNEREYDRQGNLLRESVFHRPIHGWEKYDYVTLHEYDAKGDRIKSLRNDNEEKLCEYTQYSRDSKGLLIGTQTFAATGELISVEKITYSASGEKSESLSYSYPEGKEYLYCKTLYTAGGYESTYFDRNAKPASSITEKRLSKQQLLRESFNADGKRTESETFHYDAKGNPVKIDHEYSKDYGFEVFGESQTLRRNRFNGKGLLVESVSSDSEGKVLSRQKIEYGKF